MPAKVIVSLGPLPEQRLNLLRQQFDVVPWTEADPIPTETLQEWSQGSHGILCTVDTLIPASLLAGGSSLQAISTISVGVDHIDVAAATAAGIPVGHTPGVLVDSTADLALSLMLASMRRIVEADNFIREGGWQTGTAVRFPMGTDLCRATVGVIGLGPIGQAVVKRLHAFGAKVIAWNRTPREIPGVEAVSLDELFRRSDIVTVHAAATPETHHLVSAERLAAMRDGATLINTARGSLVDEAALIKELESGRLRAGLDVFEIEPLPSDCPLLGLRNAVLAPHVGSATAATREAMWERAMINLIAGLSGESMPFCANPEVYA